MINFNTLKESNFVEFKLTFQKETIEAIVAFANAKGGDIYIGISDDSNIIGITITDETIQQYINTIKQNTTPSIIVDIEEHTIQNKTILQINVKEQPIKPISYKNKYFKRVKNSNHIMSLDEISNEHLKTINGSWDYYEDDRHDFNDISMDNIVKYIKKIEKFKDKTFDDDPMTILRKYELLKNDKLTFGAYLLFTSNTSVLTAFQIGRFKSPTKIIDNIDINTNLLDQVEIAIESIKKHLMVEYIIIGNPQREERYDYPLEANREIVINKIVHRDYRESGNSIIKIFDDRIEFFNPGKLYDDITIEKLNSNNYSSRTRNRAIARAFKEAGIIEQYGSGIHRILDECKSHGIKAPVFEEFAHGFRVIVNKEKLQNKGGGVNGGVNILKYIQDNQPVKSNQISADLDMAQRTIERYIKELKKQDKIEFKGSSRTGGYYVK